jgi:2-methylcitrate dehydratase PrpD
MTSRFLQRLTDLITATPVQGAERLPFVRQAFEDTLAVAYAGWGEPVTRRTATIVPHSETLRPDSAGADPEGWALLLGTAAHALDYDDVHQTSATHPSAPIVAALVAALRHKPELAGRMTTAYAVGLATNVGLGRVLGFPHYEKGWHATSTIGPLAAAAAVSFLYALPARPAAHALAIAAAQAGGLQRNFGAMAKPLQAGLAGSAGLRAARLARAGLTADPDVFGPKGYFDLYQGAEQAEPPEQVEFEPSGGGISVKLFPCCYLTHRPIAAALRARASLLREGIALAGLAAIEVIAPPGSYVPLRVSDPQVGSEGKFCGAYTVACALLDGQVGLAHFEDEAVHRPDVRALMERIRLVEREGRPDGMSRHSAPLELVGRDGDGAERVHSEVAPFPGSPDDPVAPAQMEAKVRDCLAYYARHTGFQCAYGEFQSFIDDLCAPAPELRRAAAGD